MESPDMALSNGAETVFFAATVLLLISVNLHHDGRMEGRTDIEDSNTGTNLPLRSPKTVYCDRMMRCDRIVKQQIVLRVR